ncbi:hypothetical protein Y032_0014g2279 [Ancylostoma ceylanicum]|uniref:Uncharacterized protein n=1 Tax=Ancylostoma ceylanicum TaxID=53326 RepID=A0A016VBG1_9BILA|nr:hypothetical protein Y032_0014g2279 [Ancylostoma ceylanicum]
MDSNERRSILANVSADLALAEFCVVRFCEMEAILSSISTEAVQGEEGASGCADVDAEACDCLITGQV